MDVLFSAYFSLDYEANVEHKISAGRRLERARITTNAELKEKTE